LEVSGISFGNARAIITNIIYVLKKEKPIFSNNSLIYNPVFADVSTKRHSCSVANSFPSLQLVIAY
jgi:hypothetical protein